MAERIAIVLLAFRLGLSPIGALLPALWVDKGFPALLELLDVRSVRLGAFGELAASGGGNTQ